MPRPWFPYHAADDPTATVMGWGWWYSSVGGYNIGGHASFYPDGAQFLGPDWRERIRMLGGDSNAEYMSAWMQVNAPGADKYDYEIVLYRRDGNYYKPIAAYYRKRESSWVETRDALVPFVLTVVAIAGGQAWLASNIGAAVVTAEFAAAYPAATQAIGQIAVSTAMSGGDVESAVMNTAASYIGAGVGGAIGATFDSQAIGKAAAAATTAALRDGDVKQAAALSFLQSGAKTVDEYLTQPAKYVFGGEVNFAIGDQGLFPGDPLQDMSTAYFAGGYSETGFLDPVPGGAMGFKEMAGSPSFDYRFGGGMSSGYTSPYDLEQLGVGLPTMTEAMSPAQNATPTPTDTGGGIFGSGISVADITNLALAAIKVNAAYQASQSPPLRTSVVTSAGVTKTPNANGTLTVRAPSGQVATVRPEVGVPYTLPDGRTIINNGNGTYSTVLPNGQTTTTTYASLTHPGEVSPALLWGGLAIGGGLLFLASRR